jgi:hypothetical protein
MNRVTARGRRPRQLFMAEFGEQLNATGSAPISRVAYQARETCEWLVPDSPAFADHTETVLCGLVVQEEDLQQASVSALNILCVAYPGLDPAMGPLLERMGIRQEKIKIPSEAAANAIPTPEFIFNPRHLGVIHAMLFILMFKNVTNVNYDNFMSRRITALRAIVGLAETDSTGLRLMSIEKAQNFKAIIGNNPLIKKEIVEKVLPYTALNADADAAAMMYAVRISAWADMTVITFIVDEILRPNSPILRHPKLMGEVFNLRDALTAISKCQFPQFFKTVASPPEKGLVERSKFPVLSSVAWEIRKAEFPSLTQFVGQTSASNSSLVAELLVIHRNFVANNLASRSTRVVELLTDFESREDQEDSGDEATQPTA